MSVNRFCGNCGSPLVSGASFCSQCGTPVPSQPIPAPAQPSHSGATAPTPGFNPLPNPSGEQTLGVIPNLIRKTGIFSQAAYCGIVTNRRIIFAQITNEMLNRESRHRYAEGKSKGEGWLSAAFDSMTVGYDFYKRYLDMPLASALSETPGNFAIDLATLNAVRVSRGARHMQKNRFGGTANSWDNGKLEMVAAGVEYNFQVLDNNLGVTRETLSKAGIIVK